MKVIFLDIDGVLNEVEADSYELYSISSQLFDAIETANDFDKALEEYTAANKIYKKSLQALSELAVQRVAMITKATGAKVVLNGTQGKPLYENAYEYWDSYNGYTTNKGDRIMDLFQKYDIPVIGYAYERDTDYYRLSGINGKVKAALRFCAQHQEIVNFLIIEDAKFNWTEDDIKEFKFYCSENGIGLSKKNEEMVNNFCQEKNVVSTIGNKRKNILKGLDDEKAQEAIIKLNLM